MDDGWFVFLLLFSRPLTLVFVGGRGRGDKGRVTGRRWKYYYDMRPMPSFLSPSYTSLNRSKNQSEFTFLYLSGRLVLYFVLMIGWRKDGAKRSAADGTLLSFPVPLDQKITMSGLWKKSSCNVETLTMERLDAQLVSLHSCRSSNRDSWFVSYRYPLSNFRSRDSIFGIDCLTAD